MQHLREQLVSISQQLCHLGLNRGTSGNVSVRVHHEADLAGFLITPSGMPANKMTPADMVWMDFLGNATGEHQPSSEWRFHLDILQQKPHINAVIHTHSLFATTLSTLRRDIPAFHYMIALAGGDSIRCAPYALFGSQQLSDYALGALQDRKACLLANHGMIAVGETLENALNITQEVETLSAQYLQALQVGQPYILTAQEMQEVQEKFKGYGAWK
ncbi:MAG: class II aldolase [Methylotenera sp.]|nr:class II aldolase [Methylotenera sp.]